MWACTWHWTEGGRGPINNCNPGETNPRCAIRGITRRLNRETRAKEENMRLKPQHTLEPLKKNGRNDRGGEGERGALLIRIIISVNQLNVYGAVAEWCQELAQQNADLSSSGKGNLVVYVQNDSESKVVPRMYRY